MTDDIEPVAARIPADVDQPDKIMYGLTGRQLAILATTGAALAILYASIGPWVPLPFLVGLLFPVAVAGVSLALGRRDGLSLDRFTAAGLDHLRRRRELVAAPEDVPAAPGWCRLRGRLPGRLRLPVRAIREDGVLELEGGSTAALVKAGTISFGLRTAAEQAALVGFFGRWLNSLEAPVQILIQARPVDLSELTDRVTQAAPHLPHPSLTEAALAHAAYLEELWSTRSLLHREVLVVLRHQPATSATGRRARTRARDAGAAIVARRAAETVRALTGFGLTAQSLNADQAAAVLTEAFSPGDTRPVPSVDPEQPITTENTELESQA